MGTRWRAVEGEVRVPAEEAEWWGAALAVLVAAIHHPHVLAARQPDTDPAHLAHEVLGGLGALQAAVACAAGHTVRDDAEERRGPAAVHAEGDELLLSPGSEVANLAFCLLVFATAVLDPGSPEGSIARGATAYASSAWSRDIGRASGALLVMGRSGWAGAGEQGADVEPPRAITSRSPLEAALAYAATGCPVLPVAGVSAGGCGCRRPCESPGKHPLTRHGVHEATTDPVLIREWWRRSPGANVGIATGASSGLLVVDLDLPRGGRESLGAVLDAGRDLPRTLRGRTGGGGLHLFYAAPPNVRVANTAGRLPGVARPLPGIDLRGDGGYVVVPPSVHASGRRYRWDRRVRVSALPAWLWTAPPAPPTRAAPVATTWEGASAYGAAALSRQLERVRGLAVGGATTALTAPPSPWAASWAAASWGRRSYTRGFCARRLPSGSDRRRPRRRSAAGCGRASACPAGPRCGGRSRRACERRGDDGGR